MKKLRQNGMNGWQVPCIKFTPGECVDQGVTAFAKCYQVFKVIVPLFARKLFAPTVDVVDGQPIGRPASLACKTVTHQGVLLVAAVGKICLGRLAVLREFAASLISSPYGRNCAGPLTEGAFSHGATSILKVCAAFCTGQRVAFGGGAFRAPPLPRPFGASKRAFCLPARSAHFLPRIAGMVALAAVFTCLFNRVFHSCSITQTAARVTT